MPAAADRPGGLRRAPAGASPPRAGDAPGQFRAGDGPDRHRAGDGLAIAPLVLAMLLLPFNPRPLHPQAYALLLVLAGAYGLARSALAHPARWRPPRPVAVPALALAAWGSASVAWSIDAFASYKAACVLAVAVLGGLLLASAATPSQGRVLLGALVCGGAAAALAGAVELWGKSTPFPGLPVSGPFLYKNATAAYLLAAAALALGWSAEAAGWQAGALAAGAALMLAVLVLTLSRGALYLAPAVLGLLLALTPGARRPALLRRLGGALAAAALLAAALVALQPARWQGVPRGASPPLLPVAAGTVGEVAERLVLSRETSSVAGRLSLWRAGLAMAADRPWTGFGLATYADAFPSYQVDWRTYARDAHNAYVQLAAELGVPGLLTFVAVLAGALALLAGILPARAGPPRPGAYRAPGALAAGCAAAVAALALHAGLDIDLQIPGMSLTFWLLLGAALAVAGRPSPAAGGAAPAGATLLRPGALRTLIALAALAAAALVARPFAAEAVYARALEAYAAGDLPQARVLLERAARLAGSYPQPRYLLAVLELEEAGRQGDPARADRALARLEELARRRPFDDELHARLGSWYERWGRPAEAGAHLRAAARAFPHSPFHRCALARFLAGQGQLDEARREVEAVLANPAAFSLPFQDARRVQAALATCEALRRAIAGGAAGRPSGR